MASGNKKIAALSVGLLSIVFAISCEKRLFLARGEVQRGTTNPSASQNLSLIGVWTSDARDTQLGRSVFTVCFSPDGKFRSSAKTQAGVIENSGTFRVDGNAITFKTAEGAVVVQTFRWHGDSLELTEQEHETVSYRRTSAQC